MEIKLTFDLLTVLSAALVIFAWLFPGVKTWFGNLDPAKKQLAILGTLAGITVATVLLSYFEFLDVYNGTTWQEWVWYPVVDFVIAIMTSAGVYTSTKHLVKDKKAGG